MWNWILTHWQVLWFASSLALIASFLVLALFAPRPWGIYVSHCEAFSQVFMRVAHPRRWPLRTRVVEYFYQPETEGRNPYWVAYPTGETWVLDESLETSNVMPQVLLTGMLEFARARTLQETRYAVEAIAARARQPLEEEKTDPGLSD